MTQAAVSEEARVGGGAAQQLITRIPDAGVEAVKYCPLIQFPFFSAEFALVDQPRKLSFHFFLTAKQWEVVEKYNDDTLRPVERHSYAAQYSAVSRFWKETFPTCMDKVAQEYFRDTAPNLKAAYTEELNSWWLSVSDVDNRSLFPSLLADDFLKRLSGSLETLNANEKR
jgi:hypothetical protein